jgi:hypothetical protein
VLALGVLDAVAVPSDGEALGVTVGSVAASV